MAVPQADVPFQEPAEGEVAGNYAGVPNVLPYEAYMAEQHVPVYRCLGIEDVRELELGRWERLGADGAFVALEGASDLLGLQVLGLPRGRASTPIRHIYEEFYQVIDGYGTTEVWLEDGADPVRFEWGEGSLFTVPRNAWHRLVCASPRGARVIAANNAPRIINAFGDLEFVFDNDFRFGDVDLDENETYRPRLDFLTSSNGRAMLRTNIVPDLATMTLARDGQRGRGTRRMQLGVPGSRMHVFANEYPVGRYSRAHYHPSGAVLICLTGKGYTLNWPREAGTRPWQDGRSDDVERIDYVPGGLVAAAPGGGDWFHQHFGVGREPLRLLAVISLALEEVTGAGRPDEQHVSQNRPISEGGRTIPYHEEDPYVRREFERMLATERVESKMPADAYTNP